MPQIEFTKVVREAIAYWMLTALAVYVGLGIVFALIAKLSTSDRHGTDLGKNLTFSDGFTTGWGTLLFFHGVLFTMVPMAMVGLPIIKNLPIILALNLFLVPGAYLLWRVLRKEASSFRVLRWGLLLAFFAIVPTVPHDLIRKSMPLPPPLPPDVPRVLIVGIDGARKDLVERYLPSWKPPNDVNSVCVSPATRRSWSMLLGKDPEKLKNSIIMPFRRDLGHPEELKLLGLAREKGLRTAWAIDDSLTAGFSNQANYFTTLRESPGGWKYWFTLGMGTAFPVYSWAQNYAAPIENTNPWADIRAYYRDLERLVKTHHWVFSHTCSLHEPIRLTFGELQRLQPWRWVFNSAWSYRPYEDTEQPLLDPSRLDLRSSALYHYSVRLSRVVLSLDPMLKEWEAKYPHLSGLVTADHGEYHLPLENDANETLSHLEGFHGFTLEPNSMWVPMHPFGKTKSLFAPGQIFTWIELRDGIANAAQKGGDLILEGRDEPFLIQFPTIRAVHLQTTEEKQQNEDLGIDPKTLLNYIYVLKNGLWFGSDPSEDYFKGRKVSSGLVKGNSLLLFNPVAGGKFERLMYERYKLISKSEVTPEEMAEEVEQMKSHLPKPMTWEGIVSIAPDAARPSVRNSMPENKGKDEFRLH